MSEWKLKKAAFISARKELNQQIVSSSSNSSSESDETDDAEFQVLLQDKKIPPEWKQEWKKKRQEKRIAQRRLKAAKKAAIQDHKAVLKQHKAAKKEAKQEWKKQTSEWKQRVKEWKGALSKPFRFVGDKDEGKTPAVVAEAPSVVPSAPPAMESEIETCRSMGFLNDELSRNLIRECDGKMDKVVSALLAIAKLKEQPGAGRQ